MDFNWVERRTVCPECNTITKTIELPMSVWIEARRALIRELDDDNTTED